MTQHYTLKEIEFDRFDDYYYMRKLSQLNQRLGFCSTLSEYSYAYRDESVTNNKKHAHATLAGCKERKLVMAAFNDKDQTVGMAGFSYKARTRGSDKPTEAQQGQGSVMVYLWGVYVEKPHRKKGIAKQLIVASIERIAKELGCSDDDILLKVVDGQFNHNIYGANASHTYRWSPKANALVVNLRSMTRGQNRIDQGLGFDADPETISSPDDSKIKKAS